MSRRLGFRRYRARALRSVELSKENVFSNLQDSNATFVVKNNWRFEKDVNYDQAVMAIVRKSRLLGKEAEESLLRLFDEEHVTLHCRKADYIFKVSHFPLHELNMARARELASTLLSYLCQHGQPVPVEQSQTKRFNTFPKEWLEEAAHMRHSANNEENAIAQ